MLELWDQELKKKKQKKPDSHAKGLMDNGDNEEEQMDNVNLEVKIREKMFLKESVLFAGPWIPEQMRLPAIQS